MTAAGAVPRPRLLIGTPTRNGVMLSDHVSSLLALSRRLDAAGLDWQYRAIDGSNAGVSRDYLARHCVQGDRTHLLLLDGDVAFPADLAERLLARRKPVVGAVQARRGPDLGRLARLIGRHGFDDAFALSFDWDVEPLGPDITVENGLMRVAAIGTAALLIERGCLERLIAGGGLATYRLDDRDEPLHAVFRDLHEAGERWDGDHAFSRRWRASGGEVVADVTADVRRVGLMRYGPAFSAFLHAIRGAPAVPHAAELAPDRAS